MRAEVVEALRSLSDPERQRTRWGRHVPGQDYYDDLDMNVHVLYDDTEVLPNPETAVPEILHESEVSAVRGVGAVLGPLIRELGDRPDEDYLSDQRWPDVVAAARAALAAMQTQDAAPIMLRPPHHPGG